MKQKVIIKQVDWFSVTLIIIGALSGIVAIALVVFDSLTPLIVAPSFFAIWSGAKNFTKQTAHEIEVE